VKEMKKYLIVAVLIASMALPALVFAGPASEKISLKGTWDLYGEDVKGYITVTKSGKVTGGEISLLSYTAVGEFTIVDGQLNLDRQTGKVTCTLVEDAFGAVTEIEATMRRPGDMMIGEATAIFGFDPRQMVILIKEFHEEK
jgi:hypothetical protein